MNGHATFLMSFSHQHAKPAIIDALLYKGIYKCLLNVIFFLVNYHFDVDLL